jgi:hypothetical protein
MLRSLALLSFRIERMYLVTSDGFKWFSDCIDRLVTSAIQNTGR